MRRYAPDDTPVVENGPTLHVMWVLASGSMELVRGGVVVDVLEPGECFGHPSLLSGLAPAFTVRAREQCECIVIPGGAALRALGTLAGTRYVGVSLRDRLMRTAQTVQALPGLTTTRLSALVRRRPLVLADDATVRDAARAMTAEHVSAALVHVGPDLGIVTDADLRERVLAGDRSADDLVRTIARVPAPTAPAARTAGETLVDLLDREAHEVCVTGRDGAVLGLLTVEDLSVGERSPFALRSALQRAGDEEALAREVRDGLPRLLDALLSSGLAAVDVCRVLTIQSDTATARLVDFATARHGQAPVAWAWMGLGSVARREVTLASDQDNALAYADGAGPDVDGYFERVATDVNAGLARCGFGADRSDVLARNPTWRMAAGTWQAVFKDCLEHPDRSRLVRAAVAFDFRHVMGGLPIAPPLVQVVRQAPAYPDFVRRLARTVTDLKVPLTRRGAVATEKDGTVDLKHGGTLPIANLARMHALANGITISGTVARLTAAEEVGALEPETGAGLREAFAVVTRARLEHHAACLRGRRQPDNALDPGALPPLRRAELREALRTVAAAQKKLGVFAPIGL